MWVAGVNYEIRWRDFKRGSSIFIPCLNPRSAKAEVLTVTKRLKFKVLMKIVIVEGVRGLRIWRL